MSISEKFSIKILIADDHEIVRQGLKTILSEHSDLEVVAEANNGNEVLKIIQKTKVDLVLLDFDMPEKNGLDTLIELKKSDCIKNHGDHAIYLFDLVSSKTIKENDILTFHDLVEQKIIL